MTPPPYTAEAYRHDVEIVRDARLAMQALRLAREMETGETARKINNTHRGMK